MLTPELVFVESEAVEMIWNKSNVPGSNWKSSGFCLEILFLTPQSYIVENPRETKIELKSGMTDLFIRILTGIHVRHTRFQF